jgi:hypothetical protein
MRTLLILICLLPYAYFGLSDVWHHTTRRPVRFTERLLHLIIGSSLTIAIPAACRQDYDVFILGVLMFLLARTLDEFLFHRNLLAEEINLHAKTHFGFLIFVVGFMVLDRLEPKFRSLF